MVSQSARLSKVLVLLSKFRNFRYSYSTCRVSGAVIVFVCGACIGSARRASTAAQERGALIRSGLHVSPFARRLIRNLLDAIVLSVGFVHETF